MPTSIITIDNKEITLDKDGFLKDLKDWNEAIASYMAKQENIQLNDSHWEVIHTLRKFYQTYQLSPAMRVFTKYIAQELGNHKGNSIYLMQLFPGSPAKLASKIAGLPKPNNCL